MAVWIVAMTLFGFPHQVKDTPTFTNESGCYLWVRANVDASIQEIARVRCVQKSAVD